MNSHASDSTVDSVAVNTCNATLIEQILGFVGNADSASSGEQRNRDRYPIYCTMQLTPIGLNGEPLTEKISTIVGKDLSVNGISFSHDFPLSHRRVIISLPHSEAGQLSVEAELSWTRQTPIGLFESGCRLIRKIAEYHVRRKE
jgi:hypothetical protein